MGAGVVGEVRPRPVAPLQVVGVPPLRLPDPLLGGRTGAPALGEPHDGLTQRTLRRRGQRALLGRDALEIGGRRRDLPVEDGDALRRHGTLHLQPRPLALTRRLPGRGAEERGRRGRLGATGQSADPPAAVRGETVPRVRLRPGRRPPDAGQQAPHHLDGDAAGRVRIQDREQARLGRPASPRLWLHVGDQATSLAIERAVRAHPCIEQAGRRERRLEQVELPTADAGRVHQPPQRRTAPGVGGGAVTPPPGRRTRGLALDAGEHVRQRRIQFRQPLGQRRPDGACLREAVGDPVTRRTDVLPDGVDDGRPRPHAAVVRVDHGEPGHERAPLLQQLRRRRGDDRLGGPVTQPQLEVAGRRPDAVRRIHLVVAGPGPGGLGLLQGLAELFAARSRVACSSCSRRNRPKRSVRT